MSQAMSLRNSLFSLLLLMICGCGDSPASRTTPASSASGSASPVQKTSQPATVAVPLSEGDSISEEPITPSPLPWQNPDSQKLADSGISRNASRHLLLFSDLPVTKLSALPGLVDQFDQYLQEYIGPASLENPAQPQVTVGYLMADQGLFEKLKLLPEKIPPHHTGWYMRQTIWVQNQTDEYYRRHLLFHEYVHAFLARRGARGLDPWFEEGLAEALATHRLTGQQMDCLILPRTSSEFDHWGRIEIIQRDRQAGRLPSLSDISQWKPEQYASVDAYAWSWALCFFLDQHPRHQKEFRVWMRDRFSNPPERKTSLPWEKWNPEQHAEWGLFLEELDYGFDLSRFAMNFLPSATGNDLDLQLKSDQGWQSTTLNAVQNTIYKIEQTGEISLAEEPRPWTSTARGISIHYNAGQPIGRILARQLLTARDGSRSFGPVIPWGTLKEWKAPATGELFLRVNENYRDLADNRGTFRVIVKREP